MSYERACTRHSLPPMEAETVVEHGCGYVVLRCVVCNRPQGMRWVRRRDWTELRFRPGIENWAAYKEAL